MVTVAAQIESKQDVRDEILQAALKLFTAKGYFNTSIADICHEAEVSTGTVYYYFKNKEGIAEALLGDVVHSLTASIAEITAKSHSAFERLRAILELFFTLTQDAPEVMRFIVYLRHHEFLPNCPSFGLSEPFQQLTQIMREGIQAGEIRRMDPAIASACFYGALVQIVQLRLDGVLEKSPDRYLFDTWTAIWRALAPA